MATRSPEIPLDQRLLDLLSSKTRRQILFQLEERPHTVSELSEALDFSKPTLHEHLGKLEDAGLVERKEDDRLWVYWELTDRGENLITPSGSQLRVVVGVAVAALVLGAVAAAAIPAPSFGGGGDEPDEPRGPATLLPEPRNVTVLNRAGTPLEVGNLSAYEGPLEAYLVPAEDAGALLSATPETVQVVPLDVDRSGENTTLRIPEGTPGGTYRLYLEAADRNNADRMTTVRVEPATAQLDPPAVWKGLDRRLDVEVPEGPLPAEGRLLVTPADGRDGPSVTAPLADRAARLGPEALEPLAPGRYELTLLGEDRSVELHATLAVRDPGLAVAPRLQAPTDAPEAGVTLAPDLPDRHLPPTVRVDGDPADAEPGLGNTWTVPLPQGAGPAPVEVAGLEPVTVATQPALSWDLEDRGDSWTLTLAHPNGTPLQGAVVALDNRPRDVTDETGTATIPEPAPGRHRLRVEAPSGAAVVQPVGHDDRGLRALAPRTDVAVTDLATDPAGRRIVASVDGPPAGAGTLVALEEGRIVGAAPLPDEADGTTEVVLPVAPATTEGPLHLEVRVPTPPLHEAVGEGPSRNLTAGPTRASATVVAGNATTPAPAAPDEPGDGTSPWVDLRVGRGAHDGGDALEEGAGVPGLGWSLALASLAAAGRLLARRRRG